MQPNKQLNILKTRTILRRRNDGRSVFFPEFFKRTKKPKTPTAANRSSRGARIGVRENVRYVRPFRTVGIVHAGKLTCRLGPKTGGDNGAQRRTGRVRLLEPPIFATSVSPAAFLSFGARAGERARARDLRVLRARGVFWQARNERRKKMRFYF